MGLNYHFVIELLTKIIKLAKNLFLFNRKRIFYNVINLLHILIEIF